MRIIESRSIDNNAGLLGSKLITGTAKNEGAFQSFIVAEDTVVQKVYNSIGIDITEKLGLTSVTLKAGAFIPMPRGDYFSSITLTSGSIVAYYTSHGGLTITADAYMNEFLARTGSSYIEAAECAKAIIQNLIVQGLLQKASLVLAPSMYQEDLIKSVVPQDGSGDLTFTRASDGTRINSAGLVENCPWNLAQYSEDFSNGVWANSNITVTTNAISSPNGTTTADKIENNVTSGNHFVRQTLTVISSQVYTLSVYLKAGDKNIITIADGFNTNQLATYNLSTETATNVGGTNASISNVGNGWFRCSVTYTPASTILGLMLFSGTTYAGTETSGYFYAWGAQLNIGSTAKPYFPTTNRQDVPRLTYQNGGGGCPSLLLEKQSTNLFTYSESTNDFSSFGQSNTTYSSGIGFNGFQSSCKITFSTFTNSYPRAVLIYNAISGQNNYFTLHFKKKSGFYVRISFGNATSIFTVQLNLGTGELISTTGTAVGNTKISILGDDTYQVGFLTSASGTTGAGLVNIDFYNNSSFSNWTNSNASDFGLISGIQWENQVTYGTSYIPTNGSSVTRLADGASLSSLNSKNITSSSAYTLFFDFGNLTDISNADLTLGNLAVYIFNNSWFLYDLSVGTILNSTPITGNRKIAITYSSGVLKAFANNTKLVTYSGTMTSNSWDAYPRNVIEFNEMLMFNTALTEAQALSLIQ